MDLGSRYPRGAAQVPTAEFRRSDFAWEFLRRNPEFRRLMATRLKKGRAADAPTEDSELRRWGLRFPADPDVPAPEAEVFWSPQAAPALVALLEPVSVDDGRVAVLPARPLLCRPAQEGLHLRLAPGAVGRCSGER
jgi:hypothetical protein